MVATTNQKARLLDLTTGVLELVRDGKRDPDKVCAVLQIIKENRNFASTLRVEQQAELKIWKTIKLGLRKSPEEYRKALEAGKCQIDTYAGQILDKILVSQEEVEVDLVLVTGRQLGCIVDTRRDLIFKRALKRGLQKCPAEVGLALREQYPDQPLGLGEWLRIGMEPIIDSDGDLETFELGRVDNVPWLSREIGDPDDDVWSPDIWLVFVLPRK